MTSIVLQLVNKYYNLLMIVCFSQSSMSNLQCMLQRDNSNLLVAGHQNSMIEVDLKTGTVTGEVLYVYDGIFTTNSNYCSLI